jgi:AmmeMemoRadiSam system protein B/AmmeMemoRadiSam system protein A
VASYSTPLGETLVDDEILNRLLDRGAFQKGTVETLCDHSVEIQLPLLQRASPETRIVPVYVSRPDTDLRHRAAAELAKVAGPEALLIASSDFTHYGDSFGYKPFPHDGETAQRLRTLDEGFIEAAGSIDAELLTRTLRSESATVCGREPIALLLDTLRRMPAGNDHFQQTLDYETSGDVTGDYSQCVSYAALAYLPWDALQVEAAAAGMLLESARQTLRTLQETGQFRPVAPIRQPPGLARRAGAFVTIYQAGNLRGCIGRVSSGLPLSELVPELTRAAATEDGRFRSISHGETNIDIEVSVLSPMKLVAGLERFRIGIDGGYLKADGKAGLLLPQVANGRGWDSADFLAALARKTQVSAGVYEDSETRLYTFRAQLIP